MLRNTGPASLDALLTRMRFQQHDEQLPKSRTARTSRAIRTHLQAQSMPWVCVRAFLVWGRARGPPCLACGAMPSCRARQRVRFMLHARLGLRTHVHINSNRMPNAFSHCPTHCRSPDMLYIDLCEAENMQRATWRWSYGCPQHAPLVNTVHIRRK